MCDQLVVGRGSVSNYIILPGVIWRNSFFLSRNEHVSFTNIIRPSNKTRRSDCGKTSVVPGWTSSVTEHKKPEYTFTAPDVAQHHSSHLPLVLLHYLLNFERDSYIQYEGEAHYQMYTLCYMPC